MNVAWWCAAVPGAAWSWSFQAYPGIWLFQLSILAAWWLGLRRLGPRHVAPGETIATRRERAAFLGGWALLWIALDWPLGPLAAGYLMVAHMAQYVLLIWFVGPLLEVGTPPWMRRRMRALRGPIGALVRRPFLAFAFFNIVLVVTHVPLVTDTLKPLQLGSMAIDVLWIASAYFFWLSTSPEGSEQSVEVAYGRRFIAVVGIKVLPILLGAFYVLAEFPIYRTFELAVRLFDMSAREDQVLGGWLMWAGTTPLLIWRVGSAWFRWWELEQRRAGSV